MTRIEFWVRSCSRLQKDNDRMAEMVLKVRKKNEELEKNLKQAVEAIVRLNHERIDNGGM